MIRRLLLAFGLTAGLAAVCLGIGIAPLTAQITETARIRGHFVVECWRPDGTLRWRDEIRNVVAVDGKNLMLNTAFEGSGYTVVGPFVGLISNTSFGGVNTLDTMSSHAGWLEAGDANAPTYSPPRKTPTWSAASGGIKQFATPVTFVMLGSGTLRGAFLVYGTGASSTIDNTGGVLWSAGTFSTTYGVSAGDLVKVSYATSL